MSKAKTESNGDVGIDRVKQQQDRLAKELRHELRAIDEKRQEVLNRVTTYFRTGLLTAEHVTFIRSKKEPEIPPYKRRKMENEVAAIPPAATARPKPCPLSRKPVHSSPPSSGDCAPEPPLEHHPVPHPIVDENVFCTIRISEDESSGDDESLTDYYPGERRSGPHRPSELFGGVPDAEERLETVKKILSGWTIKSFPRNCPLCINRFSHKRSLIRHLFGDRNTTRPATCPGLTSSTLLSFPAGGADLPAVQSSSEKEQDNRQSSRVNENLVFHSDVDASIHDDDFGPDEAD